MNTSIIERNFIYYSMKTPSLPSAVGAHVIPFDDDSDNGPPSLIPAMTADIIPQDFPHVTPPDPIVLPASPSAPISQA